MTQNKAENDKKNDEKDNEKDREEGRGCRGRKRKRVIGLTGGIGAGKSRILGILKKKYKAEVITTDQVAHELMEPGREGYQRIRRILDSRTINPDGTIDRMRLSGLMFQDAGMRKMVNGIIHPLVWKAVKDKISSSQSDLIVVESAIMGKEQYDFCDEMWYVYASEENRLKRLEENRGYKKERSLSIMNSQPSEEEFRMLADRVIDNNGTLEEVEIALNAILKEEGRGI